MFLLLFACIPCEAQTATCINWEFFNLSSPAGLSTIPLGINRWGTVVGYAQSSDGSTALGLLRYSNGTLKTYMAPNALRTYLTRRNAQGVTVGWYADLNPAQDVQGVVVSGSNAVTVNYPGATATVLEGVNYWGTIVGIWSNTNPGFTAPWDSFKLKNGVFTPIKYPGSITTNVMSINDKGAIVGYYNYYKFNGNHLPNHGFILTSGVYKTLDNPNGGGGTFLNDINGSGVIAGTYYKYGFPHGFIYVNGTFKDVKPPNFTYSTLDGINGYGYVTGTAYPSSGSGMAFTAHCQ